MTLRPITSLTHERVKWARSLHRRKERTLSGSFLVEGLKLIIDAVELGQFPTDLFMVSQTERHPLLQFVIDQTLANGGTVFEVTSEIVMKIANKENPQTVLAIFPQIFRNLSDLDLIHHNLFVALEQVRDPGNLGTIIRTVDAVNAGGVILIGDCVDPYGLDCVRASMGSIFNVPIVKLSLDEFKSLTSDWQGSIVAGHLGAKQTHYQAHYKAPCLILMGTEQSGLSETITNCADTLVKIPMKGRADSLNLAVSTAIMLYGADHGLNP
jgi:TrmH family RNA methyltransferase